MDEKTGFERVLGVVILVLRELAGRCGGGLHGWTQEELGKKVGLSGPSISNYEQGLYVPPPDVLEKILGVSGVTRADADRLAAEILRVLETMARSALPAGQVEAAERIAAELAADFQAQALPRVHAFLAARREAPVAAEEARREARALWVFLERTGTGRLPGLAAAFPELLSWADCELLADKSLEAAADDADRALELAELALWVAGRVPGAAIRLQCEGYSWGCIGNARRVQSSLWKAKEALATALQLWEKGTAEAPAILDGTRLLSLKASLAIDQRHLAEARALLAQAAAQASAGLPLGRLLIKDAYALELMGDYHSALETLRRAAPLIPEAEVRQRWALQFNEISNLCHLGETAEAERLLPGLRALAAEIHSKLDGVRLRWLEARVDAGAGRRQKALEALSSVRAYFADKKIRYDEALVSLELAGLYLEQGRTADVKRLVRLMAPVFQAEGIDAEAKKALALFRRAVEMETVTRELVRRLVAYLYRAQYNPELPFAAEA
ncbi:MAG TPA: helix-turn-helix transcriptional regulator [Thermoanaerobaculia bacterium]|jgi:transcriptional regulator with XRE-family HTH domain|nr:helix-turn-helix transcriptional regulator [Thermoanaerobaculia bacterium]